MKKIFYIYFYLLVLLISVYIYFDKESITLTTDKLEIKPVIKEYSNTIDFNYYRNLYNNDEIIGNIKIDNYIDTLFVKGTDNSFYLDHDLYKKDYLLGSIFMDYRTNLLDKKIIIYGHNFKYYKTEFGILEKYLDNNFYKNNKNIEIITDNYYMLYKIFSVYLTKDDYEYFDVEISDYNRHFNNLKNNSIYKTNVEVNEEDNVLILQTCSNNYENYFVIICAKRIEKRNI